MAVLRTFYAESQDLAKRKFIWLIAKLASDFWLRGKPESSVTILQCSGPVPFHQQSHCNVDVIDINAKWKDV